MFDFTGQVALVTGAGNEAGIGFASARALAAQGATVILSDISPKVNDRVEELKALGGESAAFIGDLTDSGAVEKMARAVADQYGKIDVLVNAAGWHIEGEPEDFSEFSKMEESMWWTLLDRNLKTAYNVTRYVLPHMRKRGYGRIVNISSVLGPVLGAAGDSAYCAGKAGIVGMSKAIAIEVAAEDITINSILPGYIAVGSQPIEAYRAGLETPAGRNGTPDEVGYTVCFFASKEASYITGQTITIDGGCSIEMPFKAEG